MPMQIADLPILDVDDPVYQADPFVWLAENAGTCKIARSERGVEVLDYELCRAFLLDRILGADPHRRRGILPFSAITVQDVSLCR